MKTLLAISPHLDDAIFSAGTTLWRASRRGWRTFVATVFTGTVEQPKGFALACQLDKGLSADIDYMALRRAEDEQACALLGAEAIHLPELEAPHRGYDSAPALFADVRSDDPARLSVLEALAALVSDIRPDVILGPFGLGGHVDHLIVRDAAEALPAVASSYLWEDWPYLDRHAPPDRSVAALIPATGGGRTAKTAACAAYGSQLGFQFGGAEALAARLARQEGEWLHRCAVSLGTKTSIGNNKAPNRLNPKADASDQAFSQASEGE